MEQSSNQAAHETTINVQPKTEPVPEENTTGEEIVHGIVNEIIDLSEKNIDMME